MESTRKTVVAPRGRFLVVMRPEPAAAQDAQELARLLGMKLELMKDVLGSGLPRIIGSRSTLEEAEALARVLSARGRESIAWDRQLPLITLIHAERLVLEGGQFVLERRGRGRHFIPAREVLRVVDLRLRSAPPVEKVELFGGTKARQEASEQPPERAVLIVPEPGRGEPGVISTRTIQTGRALVPSIAAAMLLQEAVTQARALLPGRVMEVRTSAAALGVDDSGGEPLDRVLQLLARLPPLPAGTPGG